MRARSAFEAGWMAVAVVLSGCPAPAAPTDGGASDMGRADAGSNDAATLLDARTSDAASDVGVEDATASGDGARADAAPSDAGSADGGFSFVALTPCEDPGSYRDVTTNGALPSGGAFVYANPCIRVTAGATVILNSSGSHPLTPSTRGSPMSPIPSGSTAPVSVDFPTPGFYPFYCGFHGADNGGGMSGVVQVIP